MRICFVASEMTPYAKTGGLGDCVGALAPALAARGHAVSVVLPGYPGVLAALTDSEPTGTVTARFAGERVEGRLRRARTPDGVTLLAVEQPAFYDRPALYGNANGDYADNHLRFAFLAEAALQSPACTGVAVDLFHCHDWQAALVPYYLRTRPNTATAATVLTLHNLAYQGNYDPAIVDTLGLGWDAYHWRGIELYGRASLLKAGMLTADRLTTVSPRYAREIQTPEFGAGLDGVLSERRADLDGILNGVDYALWNPETDPHIAAAFSAADLAGKHACRTALAQRCGWSRTPAGPIFGVVSRLVHQKGVDLLPEIVSTVAAVDGALTVLGRGEPDWVDALRSAAAAQPHRVAVHIGFDEAFAHQIIAGADALLMPSRFEPCGLTQLYAMRYGTVPIVRGTGGLADTVAAYLPHIAGGTGFVMPGRIPPGTDEVAALDAAIRAAATAFADKPTWNGLIARGMRQRFSWDTAAAAYEQTYARARAAAAQRGPLPWATGE